MSRARAWLVLGAVLASVALGPAAAVAADIGAPARSSLHEQLMAVTKLGHDAAERRWATIAKAPAEARALSAQAANAWRRGDVLRATIYGLVLLIIGGGAEWLYWCYARRGWHAISEAAAVGRAAPLPARAATLGLRRATLSLFGAVTFLCGVLLPSTIVSWPSELQAGVAGVVLAVTAVRIFAVASALILAPRSARLRLVAVADLDARRLDFRLVALTGVLAGGTVAQSLFASILNAPGLGALLSGAAGIVAAGLALPILRSWRPAPVGRGWGTVIYPILLFLLVLLCLVLHLLGAEEIVSTVLLWAAAIAVGKMLATVVDSYTLAPSRPARVGEYRPVMHSGVRTAVFGAGILATTLVWNVPLLQLFQSPTLAGKVLVRSVDLIVIAMVAELVWVWARTIIDGRLDAITRRGHGDGPDSTTRLATLLPLLRKAVLILLVGLTSLTALSSVGVDIAPLLAGAGVLGIALGLGAQTLVRDIVSGVFYLLADSFRVGEHVEFGEIRGTVEGISLRFLRIRHQHGPVYTVPFGEIKWLVNLSRDWARMEFELRVSVETDLTLVAGIVEEIGAQLMTDPGLAIHMIEPPEYRGVVRVEDSHIVLGVRCMTKPDEGRFDVRRELYGRLRTAFDKHGIRFASRNAKPETLIEPDAHGDRHGEIYLRAVADKIHGTALDAASIHIDQ